MAGIRPDGGLLLGCRLIMGSRFFATGFSYNNTGEELLHSVFFCILALNRSTLFFYLL